MAMMTGTVHRLILEKGFGFLRDIQGREYFFHRSAVANRQFDNLQEGDQVTFEEGASSKGPRAENVMRA